MATHSNILAWKFPWTEEPAGYSPWGGNKSDTTKQLGICTHTLGFHPELLNVSVRQAGGTFLGLMKAAPSSAFSKQSWSWRGVGQMYAGTTGVF